MNTFEELSTKSFATEFLSNHLSDGSLLLFLGAGTSKGFGLPDWVGLINDMREDIKLAPVSSLATAEDLQNAADEIRDELKETSKLIELVKNHLYKDKGVVPITTAFDNHLLIAISALLMGTKRGHVTRVITLNYDSMLEWFLSVFGFVVKTIHQLPELEGSEDVRIYHPHGYIPHPEFSSKGSDFIILGMSEVDFRLGTPSDPWIEMVRHILNSGLCLFLGMSPRTLSDRALSPLFTTCGNLHKDIRPLGIWILKDAIPKTKEREFYRKNIVPLLISDEKEISEFLLQICNKAMKKIK